MYAIIGATGNTGKATAEALLAAGEPVRVVVRRAEAGEAWAGRGAEVALADLEDEAALTAAFRGASGVYLLSPPDLTTDDLTALTTRRVGTALAAAKAAGVGHVVLLSSVGAHLAEGTGPIVSLHHAERLVRASGLAATLLRPAYFQENWASVLGVAAEHGVLPSFIPAELPVEMVATADIGAFAAQALTDPPPAGSVRVWAVAGPRAFSAAEVAEAVAAALGKPVAVQAQPVAAAAPTFRSFGASEHMAQSYAELYEAASTGRLAWEDGAALHRGTRGPGDTVRSLLQRG